MLSLCQVSRAFRTASPPSASRETSSRRVICHLMHFFGSNTVSRGIGGSTNPLDARSWCKDPMSWGAGKVPNSKHRAVMFACGLVQLNAIPVTWSKVSLPIEAYNPLLLARDKDLVSNFSLGPFTLL